MSDLSKSVLSADTIIKMITASIKTAFEIKGMPFTQKELDELADKVFTQFKSNENTSE